MLNRIVAVQESDTTGDAPCTAAYYKKIFISIVLKYLRRLMMIFYE